MFHEPDKGKIQENCKILARPVPAGERELEAPPQGLLLCFVLSLVLILLPAAGELSM